MFSRRGRFIAIGVSDLQVWDVRTGTQLLVCQGHTGDITALVFHPLRRQVFSASSDGTIIAWDVVTAPGSILHTYGAPAERMNETAAIVGVCALACSSDGKLLASGTTDGQIHLWDVENGARSPPDLPRSRGYVRTLMFTKDSDYLCSASSEGGCSMWDLNSRVLVHTFRYDGMQMSHIALSRCRDLSVVACASAHTRERKPIIALWSLDSAPPSDEPLYVLDPGPGIPRSVLSIQFSPQAAILAISSKYGGDDNIHLWAIRRSSGRYLASLPVHTLSMRALEFSPDGSCVCTLDNDGAVHLLDVEPHNQSAADFVIGSQQQDSLDTPRIIASHRHDGPVSVITFSPDKQVLATGGARDGAIKLWYANTGQLKRHLHGCSALVRQVLFSSDGSRLVAIVTNDPSIHIWDIRTGRHTTALEKGDEHDAILQVAILRDSASFISGSRAGTLRLWSVGENRQASVTYTRRNNSFPQTGRSLEAALDIERNRRGDNSDHGRRWQSEIIYTHTSEIYAVTISNSETFVALAGVHAVYILDLKSRQVTWCPWPKSFDLEPPGVLSFSPCDDTLAALDHSGRNVSVWTMTKRHVNELESSLNLSPPQSTLDQPREFQLEENASYIDFLESTDHTSYIIADSGVLPLHISNTKLPPIAYLQDGWLWKTPASGGPARRVCQLPGRYTPAMSRYGDARRSIAISQFVVAIGTSDGNVVIIDLSQAQPL